MACLVLAFLTDSLKRIQWFNRNFAATVVDPIERCLPVEERFLPAMIAGPFRDRFPLWQQELSSCLSGLHREIEAGHLAPGTLRLIDDTLLLQDALRKGLENCDDWDGTMLVRSSDGQLKLVREHVLPLVDGTGRNTGLHLTQWFEVDQPAAERGTCDVSPAKLLTPRQLEIGRLYASGLTSEEVAVAAGISRRNRPRPHRGDLLATGRALAVGADAALRPRRPRLTPPPHPLHNDPAFAGCGHRRLVLQSPR